MESNTLQHIVVLLATALLLVAAFRYLRLPPLLAYLTAGLIAGPHAFGWIPESRDARELAEFGLVFLMFSIGLEFSLAQLIAMRRTVLLLGGAQVLVCVAVFGGIAWGLGAPLRAAAVIGTVLALSSTAIALKQMADQLEQNTRHGRQALGILLFQDLAVVPFLIMIPALAGEVGETLAGALGESLVKGALALALILAAGRWLLRPLFAEVAGAHSREFFMLAVLLVTLASAWVTGALGLSPALGAFFAGLMIAETEYRHQVEGDILPFRDVLMGLFFVTVGMQLDLHAVALLWPWILAGLAGILLFKTAIIVLISRLAGSVTGVALRTGLVLAPGGEFGFALLVQAAGFRLLDEDTGQGLLAALLLSMLLGPLLVRYNGALARALVPADGWRQEADLDVIRAHLGPQEAHVIVCGYGRSGQNLAVLLKLEDIPFLALDLEPARVRDALQAGEPVVYGDATRRDVLLAAGLERARALVISHTGRASALRTLAVTRSLRPDMPVIVRTVDDRDMDELRAAGASEVVPESIEGSLMIGSHLLVMLGVPFNRVVRLVRNAQQDRYRLLRGFFHGREAPAEEEVYARRLHSVTLPADAWAVGKRMGELGLKGAGVEVTAVRRGGITGPSPSPHTTLKTGDVLVLYGEPTALETAERKLMTGSGVGG